MWEKRFCGRAAAKPWKQAVFVFLSMLLIGLCFSIHVRAEGEPTVTKVRLINNNDIEIHWSEEVENAGQVSGSEQNFSVTVGGAAEELRDYWNWYPGIVYFTENIWTSKFSPNPKTSLHMLNGISDFNNLPEIKVTIKGNVIKGKTSGKFVPEQTLTVKYEPYYTQERVLSCGVRVLGSEKVRPEAMDKAKEMLEIILANPTVALRMGNAGCMMGLYGEGEHAYDIPEHRFSYTEDARYVEGFGGTQLASICDSNVLRLTSGSYTTGYADESILTHEFGHTVYNYGLTEAQQQEFYNIWETSTKSGKWANSYAGSNKDEFFATLSAMWFNTMNESWDGSWDGVRGPISTRNELKVYDREAYDFLAKVYVPNQYLPKPWANGSVPNNFTPAEIKDMVGSFDALDVEIAKAKAIERGNYTEESYTSLQNAVTEAERVKESSKSKEEIDAQTAALQAKIDGLQEEEEEPEPKIYTVTIKYYNGKTTKSSSQAIEEGRQAVKPSSPKRKGYIFKGWYLGNNKYSFNTNVAKDLVITGKWERVKVGKASIRSAKLQKGKKVVVKYKKVKNAAGYRITYARDKKFKKSKKTAYAASLNKTIKLKKGTYYIRVEAYKKDSTGSKVYGAKSGYKKVTVK